VRDHFISLTT